ncbi:Acetyltransferase Pat [Variovorax sp. SRS16]|uniref:GNAT family N-acetyltransferase n=1 Tax=Variovorax sp. SRS16 TaxID=282217 RepID=UPI0013170F35|nr:GNAT family N-acetyltransferase [Variovorax sp. SRS16]VTU13497.1 Acetyltransferase Pat [Variovorax sp. SRS16]
MTSDKKRDYPAHLIEDFAFADGTPVRIRPIRADDLASHARFVGGLSFETGYARLLSPRKPQPDELRRMTDIDYDAELALVATVVQGGVEQEIGVARFVKSETSDAEVGSAEFGIVIADAWQRRGLAEKLMRSLIAAAAGAGVRVLSDITLYDNRAMLGLARKLGFRLRRDPGNPNLTRLTLWL